MMTVIIIALTILNPLIIMINMIIIVIIMFKVMSLDNYMLMMSITTLKSVVISL